MDKPKEFYIPMLDDPEKKLMVFTSYDAAVKSGMRRAGSSFGVTKVIEHKVYKKVVDALKAVSPKSLDERMTRHQFYAYGLLKELGEL